MFSLPAEDFKFEHVLKDGKDDHQGFLQCTGINSSGQIKALEYVRNNEMVIKCLDSMVYGLTYRNPEILTKLSRLNDDVSNTIGGGYNYPITKLSLVLGTMLQKWYQKNKTRQLVPVLQATGEPGALDMTYFTFENKGEVEPATGIANTPPQIHTIYGQEHVHAHLFQAYVKFTQEELRQSIMFGQNVENVKSNGLMQAFDKRLNYVGLVGMQIGQFKMQGLFNYDKVQVMNNPAAKRMSGPDVVWNDWKAFFDGLVGIYQTATGLNVDQGLTLVVPLSVLNDMKVSLANISGSPTVASNTVYNLIRESVDFGDSIDAGLPPLRIVGHRYLENLGVGGLRRAVLYCNRSEYLAMWEVLPLTLEPRPGQHFDFFINGETKLTGVHFFRPQTAIYIDGV